MVVKYNIDLECISTEEYKEILKKQNLLASRRILQQNLDENFVLFERYGMLNLFQLKKSLSTPLKIKSFANQSGITENYLIILKREISSLEQKPVPLSSFPNIDAALIKNLNDVGLRNSKDYWLQHNSENDELFSLCDLVRINGIGPIAARVFYEAGYRSVLDVANANAGILLEKVSEVNDEKQYYKMKLGIQDMQFCIDFAQLLRDLEN